VISAAIAILGVTIASTGVAHTLGVLGVLMVVAGGAWITFISLFSALVQSMAPDWVRARVLAIFILSFQGGIAAGSALWGLLGEWAGVQTALLGALAPVASPSPRSAQFGGCRTHLQTSAPGTIGACRPCSRTWR
jgi:hypothetical protein